MYFYVASRNIFSLSWNSSSPLFSLFTLRSSRLRCANFFSFLFASLQVIIIFFWHLHYFASAIWKCFGKFSRINRRAHSAKICFWHCRWCMVLVCGRWEVSSLVDEELWRERERERERGGGEFKIVLFSMYTNVILLLRALTACGTVFLMARDLEYATIRARVTIWVTFRANIFLRHVMLRTDLVATLNDFYMFE